MSIEKESIQKDFIDVGDKKLYIGDKVVVLRTNGDFEEDRTLKSFGKKFAVVDKIDIKDGELMTKVIPIEEFIDIYKAFTQPYEGAGLNKGRIDMRTPEGRAKYAGIPEKMARAFGIDISKKDWQDELEKEIRRVTG